MAAKEQTSRDSLFNLDQRDGGTGSNPNRRLPKPRRRTHPADNLPEKDETELEPFAEAMAFAPALLTASESVN